MPKIKHTVTVIRGKDSFTVDLIRSRPLTLRGILRILNRLANTKGAFHGANVYFDTYTL